MSTLKADAITAATGTNSTLCSMLVRFQRTWLRNLTLLKLPTQNQNKLR